MQRVVGLKERVSILHLVCGISGVDRPRFQVFRCDGCETQDCAVSQIDSGRDAGTRSHPCVAAKPHGKENYGKFRIVVIVGRAAEICSLGNDGMRREKHRRGVVQFRPVGHHYCVFAPQVPGCPHAGGWIESAMRSQLCTKAAQQECAPPVKHSRRGTIQKYPYQTPQLPPHAISKCILRGCVRVFSSISIAGTGIFSRRTHQIGRGGRSERDGRRNGIHEQGSLLHALKESY